MSTGFFLGKIDQKTLATLLCPPLDAEAHVKDAGIPALIEDLTIAITGQDKIGPRALGTSGNTEQPLTLNLEASDAATMLNGELAKWVRRTASTGKVAAPHLDDTLSLAVWLAHNISELAIIEGSRYALGHIQYRVGVCRRICDRPATPEINWDQYQAAREQTLNASGIATLAKELGDEYTGLTRKRVNNLGVKPVGYWEDIPLYRIGDVLDAHKAARSWTNSAVTKVI